MKTTLETGVVDCVGMAAGGGAFDSAFAAVGVSPNSSFSEVVNGTTVKTAKADANGTVATA